MKNQKSEANKKKAPTTVGSGDLLDLTVKRLEIYGSSFTSGTVAAYPSAWTSIHKLQPDSNNQLAKALKTSQSKCLARETHSDEARKLGRKQSKLCPNKKSSCLDHKKATGDQQQTVCKHHQSLSEPMAHYQSSKQAACKSQPQGYSLAQLFLQDQSDQSLLSASAKPPLKRRGSYKCVVRSNEKS
jgi:hypothetical protein